MRTALLLITSLLAGIASAECYYSSYALTLKLTTTSGDELIRYRTISACELELDSMDSGAYLQEVLFNTDLTVDVLWYAHRAEYHSCMEEQLDCVQHERLSVHHLFTGAVLEPSSIRSIEVLENVRVPALNWISTELQVADTVLFHQKPIEVVLCSGYLCYHNIAVYKSRPEQLPVLRAIRELNTEMDSVEGGLDHSNGDAYDERMWVLIEQLRTAKDIIVVSECTD